MTNEERDERIREMLAQEQNNPEQWWYLSFATDTEFLGGTYVRARGVTTAILRTKQLCINPGGEVMCIAVPPDQEHNIVPESKRNKLLTMEELGDGVKVKDMDEAELNRLGLSRKEIR